MDELHRAMEQLGSMPARGHQRLDLADDDTRFWTVRPYVIVYLADRRPIRVLRVLSGYRDLRALLR